MQRVYQERLVGEAPRFPRAIEDGIDLYLAQLELLTAPADGSDPLPAMVVSELAAAPAPGVASGAAALAP